MHDGIYNLWVDIKQIEYFVRVAEMGSFTRAANSLNVAQPALSRQVRLLEEWGYHLQDLQINDITFDQAIIDSMSKVVASNNLKAAAENC